MSRILLISFFILTGFMAMAQADTAGVRMLIDLSSKYLLRPGEEKSDLDSALLLANQARDLSHRLHYSAGEEEAGRWIGRVYVEAGRFRMAVESLAGLSDTSQILVMQQMRSYELTPAQEERRYLDTAISRARKCLAGSLLTPTLRVEGLFNLNYYDAFSGDTIETPGLCQEIFDLCRKNGRWDKLVLVCQIMNRNVVMRDRGSPFAGAPNWNDLLLADHEKIRDPKKKAEAGGYIVSIMEDIAGHYYLDQQWSKAKSIYLSAIALGKDLEPIDITPYVFLSAVYNETGDRSKALAYALEAARIVERRGNPDQDARPYSLMGRYYVDAGKHDEAVEAFETALRLFRHNKMPADENILTAYADLLEQTDPARALSLLQEYTQPVYWSRYNPLSQRSILGAIADCYSILNQYDRAEEYALKSLDIAKDMHNNIAIEYSMALLASIYTKENKFDKVRYYIQEIVTSIAAQHREPSLNLSIQIENNLFRADTVAKQYASAIQHLMKEQALENIKLTTTKNKQFEELKIQYDLEKKDARIVSLTKEEQQSRLMRNLMTAAGILLALLLVVLYSRYRLKQKSNRRLQEQQEKINASNLQLQKLNQQQQRLLTEKEWLLKEVHHRVKNNLQIVISLLHMQSDFLSDELAVNAFGEIGHRIQAISLIHQKLYQVADMTVINMPDYVRQLVQYLKDSSIGEMPIRFDLRVDPVDLEVSQSVPVGLILNETITNSIKHAFPDGARGMISIVMRQEGENILLKIADNGVGLPSSAAVRADSMGLELVRTLVDQLEGTIDIDGSDGYSMTIRFRQQKSLFEDRSASLPAEA